MTLNMGDTTPIIDILQSRFPESERLLAAELGVYRGGTSALLLQKFTDLHLVMVDEWATYTVEHPYRQSGDGASRQSSDQQARNMQQAIESTEFASDRRDISPCDSTSEAAFWYQQTFDFVFVDADHTYDGVMADIRNWWPLLKCGGLMIFDDYVHPRNRTGKFGVDKAVDEFSKSKNLEVQTRGKLAWLQKP